MALQRIAAHVGTLVVVPLGLLATSCSVGGGEASPPDNDPIIGSSAGGETNVVSDAWELASVRGGNNVKMMNFAQMQSEVLRATGVNYDKWDKQRATFGAADFKSSFREERTPTATKVITWRKIAFAVCKEMVTKETSTPALFSAIAPTAAIDASDPKVADQVKAIFTKFFFEPPNSNELNLSTQSLAAAVAAGGTPSEAWSNLCVAYLSSMRFLTY